MPSHSALYIYFRKHRSISFILLTLSFLFFGKFSLDLVRLFSANADYILANGWMGLADGGLRQLLELIASALAGMAAYIIFKFCERVLIDRMVHAKECN